jgi:hypothetical protein
MLASSILAVSILPSTAQTVTGKVSATVDNTFGSSIGLNLQQCHWLQLQYQPAVIRR